MSGVNCKVYTYYLLISNNKLLQKCGLHGSEYLLQSLYHNNTTVNGYKTFVPFIRIHIHEPNRLFLLNFVFKICHLSKTIFSEHFEFGSIVYAFVSIIRWTCRYFIKKNVAITITYKLIITKKISTIQRTNYGTIRNDLKL